MRVRTALLTTALALACGVLATAATQQDSTPRANENAPVAGQLIRGEISSQGAEGSGVENRIVFVQPGSRSMEEMRARLADPVQRKTMRAEQRASLEQSHADAEDELELDSTRREALIELLTDQSMESLDRMFGEQREPWPSMQSMADAENRKLDQLREILGDAGLERYQEYTATTYERSQMREVDRYLGTPDKLSPEQKVRLVKLFKEKNQMGLPPPGQSRMSNLMRSRGPDSPNFRQDMERESQLATIEANEEILRLREAANRVIIERASGLLTPRQLAAVAKVNEAEVARQREWLVKARTNAGLDPAIPERAKDENLPIRKPAQGDVWLDLVVRVNGGEPVHVTHSGKNGETLKFQASADLFAEAEWTLYEDNWIEVRLTYFEEGPNGRRRLQGGSGFGTMGRIPGERRPGVDDFAARGGSSTLVMGRKAYSVELSAIAEAR